MHVEHDIPVAPLTHYRIGGVAREVWFPETASECAETLGSLEAAGIPYYILGGGSNVLVGDGYWDGAVVVTSGMKQVTIGDAAIICGAGIESSKIAELALANGKTGLEFLYLLPGTIGGAIAGNARYDDVNVSDVLVSLDACRPDGGIRTFAASDIRFAYKYTSIAKEGWIILEATLAWRDGDPAAIRARMDDIEQKRNGSHHFDYPSAGCMFKNDHARNIQVGRLLDSLGMKGMRIGDAEIADFHANFFINRGAATASDVLALLEMVERTVYEKTGAHLEREVRLEGAFGKKPRNGT